MVFSQILIWQIHRYFSFSYELLIVMFIVILFSPHLILSPTLNLRNNWGCISNLTSPFLLPIAAWLLACSGSGSLVFWPVALVALIWMAFSVVAPCFVPLSLPKICKRATWAQPHFSVDWSFVLGSFSSSLIWGLGLVTLVTILGSFSVLFSLPLSK